MSEILQPRQTIRLQPSGARCEVEELLASDGLGEVYRANLGGKEVALKWYYSPTRELWEGIETLVKGGPPSERFVWPLEMVSTEGVPGFGCVMARVDPRFGPLSEILRGRVSTNFRQMIVAGRELAECYEALHQKGFCYVAVDFGQVFIDPATGDIVLHRSDCDIARIEQVFKVIGTARFTAPEIVRREALPSRKTDLYSLSVLLFYMFMIHHPLEGKKESAIHALDLAAMNKLFGYEPLFIFDPKDNSNAPVPGYQDNAIIFWPIYPLFFREYFVRAFTEGLNKPDRRVGEAEWRIAMERLADMIVYCSNCGAQNFYDPDGQGLSCWRCKKSVTLPMRLVIGKRFVMLNHDTQLFPHHIDETKLHDFSQPAAAVQQHPKNPGKWGLKNLSKDRWVLNLPNGSAADIDPGRSASLIVGSAIQFGNNVCGKIQLGEGKEPSITIIRVDAAKLSGERFCGALLGLAVGDAVGTTVEFAPPGSFPPVTDMVGRGPFRLNPGQWTDDTSMALCLAASLAESKSFDPRDQMQRYLRWRDTGYMSSTGRLFDIGYTTRDALRRFEETADPFAGLDNPEAAGNGSIMRLAPVPMFFARDPHLAIQRAADSSRTTHGARTCLDACRYLGALISGALVGASKEEILSPRFCLIAGYWDVYPLHPQIDEVASGSFKQKQPPAIRGTGFVVESLEAALWSFYTTSNFRDGCLAAANLGNDGDTTAAVYGQLAGAFYGETEIPESWRKLLHEREMIQNLADQLFELAKR